ncbi:MAG: M1 family metallopeptidase [Anaerolineae bacterium]
MAGRVALITVMLLLAKLSLVAPIPVRAGRAVPVASYQIDVTLDVDAKTLRGHQVVTYTNVTDQPIPDLVFHLYLNAFSGPDTVYMRESGGLLKDPGWIEVDEIRLRDGTQLELEEIEDGPVRGSERGTLARAPLPEPIAPGESVNMVLDFRAKLPFVSARTGYADDFFMIGQWFPKLGVWQNGAWNAYVFHANSEFYADFGTYDVTITLPTDYATAGTGLLIETTEHGDGTKAVRYHAEDVIDFAWAASPDFRQASRRVDGTEILYVYLPEHESTVERALDAAELAVTSLGEWYGEYPYERLTVVDVPDQAMGAGGMEYPTLVTAGKAPGPSGWDGYRMLELVIVHEIGHQWWQSMVAFNEAEEPWLDEGFTDYSATRLVGQAYGAGTSLLDVGRLEVGYLDLRRADYLSNPRVPMAGRAWDFRGHEYAVATYSKPILALTTLERVIGENAMLELMRTFFQRYQFAHPTAEDFRAVAEEVTGRELTWFFEGLVYGDGVLNYAVTSLDAHSVTVVREGDLVIPTEVLVTFCDGTTVTEVWDGEATEQSFEYPDRSVCSAQIDPDRKLVVDVEWFDNGLSRRMEVVPWLALVSRWVAALQDALLALGGL